MIETNDADMCSTNDNMTIKCWLVAVDQLHDDIELPDGVAVFVGRSASTNIADTLVSRLHGDLSLLVVCCLVTVLRLIL